MNKSKGQELNELRRSSASGTHGKGPKASNKHDRRENRKALRRGDWS